MEEIWKPIKGFEMYEVSNYGEVRSLPRNGTVLKTRKLVGFIDSSGYHQVLLTEKQVHKKIHRLVALAFIANPENKPCVNHKNRIKTDNRVCNLEWCTHRENVVHAYQNGHKAQSKADHSQSKIGEVESTIIQECIGKGFTTKEIARYFNVSVNTIQSIKNRTHWTNYEPGHVKHVRMVLDLNTGVYYDSANDLAKLYGVSQPTVVDRIKDPNKRGKVFQLNVAFV